MERWLTSILLVSHLLHGVLSLDFEHCLDIMHRNRSSCDDDPDSLDGEFLLFISFKNHQCHRSQLQQLGYW